MAARNLNRSTNAEVVARADLAQNLRGASSEEGDDAEPTDVAAALSLQIRIHNDTCEGLAGALGLPRRYLILVCLREWSSGKSIPRKLHSLAVLKSIERHYGLTDGYFAKAQAKSNLSYLRRPCASSPFQASLTFEMNKHCDTGPSLAAAIAPGSRVRVSSTLANWKTGRSAPACNNSYLLLDRIEARYGLQEGHFKSLLVKPENAAEDSIRRINRAWRGAVRWHLPDNFNKLDVSKQQEILDWISENVLGGSSRYGKYQSRVTRNGFSIVFPDISCLNRFRRPKGEIKKSSLIPGSQGGYGTIAAPAALSAQLQDLLAFKLAPLPPVNTSRYERWSQVTAETAAVKYGILFGALAAAPLSHTKGFGVPLSKLTFGMLVFPKVWDWFLRWREERRGFFSSEDTHFLHDARALLRSPTGWIRQHRELSKGLRPISGLISANDIKAARRNWDLACERAVKFARNRIPEIRRVQRRHRDPFEAILPVLNSDSPLGEYRKIAQEILKYAPDAEAEPFRAAVNMRSYLLIRFGMHLGFRQRNLRDLMLTKRNAQHRSDANLEEMQRGELRWSVADGGWEVFAPSVAFKNRKSSFFDDRPFRLLLLDTEGLYDQIEKYIELGRPALLDGRLDPGTFFVRSARSSRRSTSYDLFSFYEAWKAIIQRYGIYNPYTKRGAIVGLRPHGSHAVRDVIATHVLKQTASYELTSYAIHDTVATVMEHYARFLPHEKVAKAAVVMNKVWR